MKVFHPACAALVMGALALLSACNPQGSEITELKLKERQSYNAMLRREIANMEATIRRAGDDVPGLAEQLEARSREEKQAYETIKALRSKETEIRLRRIELEKRLDAFQSTFRELQSQVAAINSKP